MRLEAGATHPDALLRLHERYAGRYPVLLESVSGGANLGRFDVLFALPGARLLQRADGAIEGPPTAQRHSRFLAALDDCWRAERGERSDAGGEMPFVGGWFLYLGYELAAEIEPSLRLPASALPRAIAWRMHGAVVRDRLTGETVLQAERGHERRLREEFDRDLAESGAGAPRHHAGRAVVDAVDEEDAERFLGGVEAVLDAIARGDVYQANLSRGWRAMLARGASAAEVYRRLRDANPAPFAGSASLPGFTLLSSSPERLLRIRGDAASTRPIAGTRPRGDSEASDAALRTELRLNEKEQAEHVMLVDLERNDLGRICRGGTVQVDEYMTIETYATVHHIVSNVCGVLRDGVTPGEAIAAVFPGGTITGCPKVRCMQLLGELEGTPRDAYTGSMGYLGRDGSLDLNILIRTLAVRDGTIEFRTGAGIVADSRPESELEETRAKARGLLRALGSNA